MSNRQTSYDSDSMNLDAPPCDDGVSLHHDMTSDSENTVPFLPPDHVAIRMEGLSREFHTAAGAKKAVDGLSLDIYGGQVRAAHTRLVCCSRMSFCVHRFDVSSGETARSTIRRAHAVVCASLKSASSRVGWSETTQFRRI